MDATYNDILENAGTEHGNINISGAIKNLNINCIHNDIHDACAIKNPISTILEIEAYQSVIHVAWIDSDRLCCIRVEFGLHV